MHSRSKLLDLPVRIWCLAAPKKLKRVHPTPEGEDDHGQAAAKTVAKKSGSKLTKAGLITAITEALGDGISRKQVVSVLDGLTDTGYKELKKSGSFVLPGFAKYVVVKRPARPAREGHQTVHEGADHVRGQARHRRR